MTNSGSSQSAPDPLDVNEPLYRWRLLARMQTAMTVDLRKMVVPSYSVIRFPLR